MATVTVIPRRGKTKTTYQVYYLDPQTGRKVYHRTFPRMKDAQQEANMLRGYIDSGRMPEVEQAKKRRRPMTFADVGQECADSWKTRGQLKTLRPKTVENYLLNLDVVNRTFGSRLMLNIREADIVDYRTAVAEDNSNVSSNRRLFIIKQVFKTALDKGYVEVDPARGIRYLDEKDSERKTYVSPGKAADLTAACDGKHRRRYVKALTFLALDYGASRQELLDLKWKDVDFDLDMVRFLRTKNDKERTRKLTPRCREALLEWRRHQQALRRRRGIDAPLSDLVFCHTDGRPMQDFRSSWDSVVGEAGLDDYHFHDNRHSFATNLALVGATLKDIQGMIGHDDPRSTNRYAHLAEERQNLLQQALTDVWDKGQVKKCGRNKVENGRKDPAAKKNDRAA
jgi:site-specific recombinase XerD